MAATSPLYNSYRAPDRDKDKLNPFYNIAQGLKDTYMKAKDAVQQFAIDSRYNLKPVVNPAYAANYNSPSFATDFDRHAAVSDRYQFRHVQP